MKTKLMYVAALVLGVALFVFALPSASAQTQGEHVENFQVEIEVREDASVLVTENITYFFDQARHGIFRNIPYKYKARGGNFELGVEVLGVTSGQGVEVPYSKSKSGGYVKLKIGDPDQTVTGLQTYSITYSVTNAVNFFTDHDELYWNVTGNEWEVPISSSSAHVVMPTSSEEGITTACFTGVLGSQAVNCSVDKDPAIENMQAARTFTTLGGLSPKEGLTIVVGWPKGAVAEPTTQDKVLARVKQNGVLALPLVVFVLLFLLWRKYGKDPELGTVVPQYEPPIGLSPVEVQFVKSGKIGFSALGAQIIEFANLGYLNIKKIKIEIPFFPDKEDYIVERVNTADVVVDKKHEELMQAIFDIEPAVSLHKLKQSRSRLLQIQIALQGYGKTTEVSGVYKPKTRGLSALLAVAGAAGLLVGLYVIFAAGGLYSGLSWCISSVVAIIFAALMPARTSEGAKMLTHILGFAEYIKVAEKDRIAFHDAPIKSPERFQKFLPFAMVLGLEKEWTKIFDGFVLKPDWYVDNTGAAFTALAFSDSVNKFSSSIQSFSTAASGGSGFSGGASGGGGGGGGGGGW